MAPASIPDAAERQFALVLALVGTKSGLGRDQILTTVNGYQQRYEQNVASGKVGEDSLRKLFERDKTVLREAGIEIETVPDPSSPDDNKLFRYRVAPDKLAAGAMRFTEEEAALLEVAALVWERGAMADHAANSIAKLRALDVPMANPVELASKPRLRSRDHGFATIAEAIDEEQAIRFRYRKQLAADAEHRRIEPQALLQFEGHWLVAGFDLDRMAERRFVLTRIEGTIRKVGPFGDGRAHDPTAGPRSRRELAAHAESQRALLALAPGGDAEIRLERRGRAQGTDARGWTLLELGFSDIELFADELTGFGPELVVHEPPALRREVIRRLEQVVAAHAGEERA